MVVALVPLLVIGVVLVVVLGVKYLAVVRELSPATATATATVVSTGRGPAGLPLRWTDTAGQQHTSRLVFPEVGSVKAGTIVTVRYVPDDPSRVYAAEDELNTRGRNFANGMLFTVLVMLVALAVTVVIILRRVRAARRRPRTCPVSWAQTRRGLIRRSWLVIGDGQREWWQPVYWQPRLAELLAGTPAKVHGSPTVDRLLPVEVGGTVVWPSGRRRAGAPKGELRQNNVRWTRGLARQREKDGVDVEQVSLRRHLLGDVGLILPAPLLGLLWAYIDGSGAGGFVVATAMLVGMLFWLPAVFGSDPT
jgi:hypothetical protein